MGLDVENIRKDFPILSETVNGEPLVYLDNASSSQKPLAVIEAISNFYKTTYSNVHRGVHFLSQRATTAYEATREKVRAFINANLEHEIIFTRGTTESINLLAATLGKGHVHQGDEIVISEMEHHSNIVPWQLLCEETGAVLKVIPINNKGEITEESYRNVINESTKIVAICHVSNTLGTINSIKAIIDYAHEFGALTVIDGAQAPAHIPVDVQQLNCDFYCFSAHKMYGPTGIGILYGKETLLDELPPYHGGGNMIENVTFAKTTYNKLPHKFEAGTPNIAGGIGLGAAIDYIQSIAYEDIGKYEDELTKYGREQLSSISNLRFIGDAADKSAVFSFVIDGIHPLDLGTILDQQGIAVRTGHHCTQPLMDKFEIPGTVRASFAFYNTLGEVDRLVNGINKAVAMLSR